MEKLSIEKLIKNCELYYDMANNTENLNEILEKEACSVPSVLLKTLTEYLKEQPENILKHFPCCKLDNLNIEAVNNILENTGYLRNDICSVCEKFCPYKEIISYPFDVGMTNKKKKINDIKYPSNSFPEPFNKYIEQLATAMVAPPQFIGTTLLAVLSVLCSRFAELEATPSWNVLLNGYFLNIGDVSTKKSPTAEKVLLLLNETISSDDRIISNDSTAEALQMLLKEYQSILLQFDEAGMLEVLGAYTKTSNASQARLLKLYTGQSDFIDRKSQKPILIERPRLSILAGVQPSILKQSKSLTTSGMLQRFMIARAERSKKYYGSSLEKVDDDVLSKVKSIISSLYQKGHKSNDIQKLILSKEAYEAFNELQNVISEELEYETNTNNIDYYGKYYEHILKITAILHLLKIETGEAKGNEISKETYVTATDIAYYYEQISINLFREQAETLIETETGYQKLLKIAGENCKCEPFTFNPTYLNKARIGGCDARKPDYTMQFIEKLVDEYRCVEVKQHTGKGRLYLLIRE